MRQKRYSESKIAGEIRRRRKEEQPCNVPARIARAVAALGDKEPNYQRGDPTDDMKREHVPHRLGSRN